MKPSIKVIVGICVSLVVLGWFAMDAEALNICEKQTFLCGGPNCIGPFTSLPITSGVLECHSTGWRPDGGSCGTQRCYLILQCPCGGFHSRGTYCEGSSQPGCDECGDYLSQPTEQQGLRFGSGLLLTEPGSASSGEVTP